MQCWGGELQRVVVLWGCCGNGEGKVAAGASGPMGDGRGGSGSATGSDHGDAGGRHGLGGAGLQPCGVGMEGVAVS